MRRKAAWRLNVWDMDVFRGVRNVFCGARRGVSVLMLSVYLGAWTIQKQTAWGRVPSGSTLSWAPHWPAVTFLILAWPPQPRSQNPVDLVAELDVLAAPQSPLKQKRCFFFFAFFFPTSFAGSVVDAADSNRKRDHADCTIKTRGNAERWIQFRAQGLISAARTLVRGSGARVADEEKALTWSLCVLCVRWDECVTEGHNTRAW